MPWGEASWFKEPFGVEVACEWEAYNLHGEEDTFLQEGKALEAGAYNPLFPCLLGHGLFHLYLSSFHHSSY